MWCLGFSLQWYTEELYKEDLHDPDNHDGVITHLEPDILECEVKWALESITRNKGMNPAAHLAIIRQLSRHESCGPAGHYQAAEQA